MPLNHGLGNAFNQIGRSYFLREIRRVSPGLAKYCDLCSNDDGDPVSSGSTSPGLGEMWQYGCPRSPDWNGDVELDSVEVEEGEDGESMADH